MKNTITILALCLLLFSCKSNKKSVAELKVEQDNTIDINTELIDTFHTNQYLENIVQSEKFETVEEFTVSYQKDELKIRLQHINNWNDPGDFIKVLILDKNDKILLEQINFNGWIRFGNNYSLPEKVLNQNKIESDKALVIENKNGMQLLLFGWSYASQPGLTSIIDLFPKPRFIFNRKYEIRDIIKNDKNGYKEFVGSTTYSDSRKLDIEKMKLN